MFLSNIIHTSCLKSALNDLQTDTTISTFHTILVHFLQNIMAQKNGDKSSLVDDFNHQHAPPQYELSSPAPTYPQPPPTTGYPAAHGANVVVVPQPMVMAREPLPDATGAIVLSCVVFWCCGCIFGLIAFIVACMCICFYLDYVIGSFLSIVINAMFL